MITGVEREGLLVFLYFEINRSFLESGMPVTFTHVPNRIQQIFNEINQGYYFYEYDWKEFYDVSIMHWEPIFGVFASGYRNHSSWIKVTSLSRRVGYLWSFQNDRLKEAQDVSDSRHGFFRTHLVFLAPIQEFYLFLSMRKQIKIAVTRWA